VQHLRDASLIDCYSLMCVICLIFVGVDVDFPEYLAGRIVAAKDLGDPAAQQVIMLAVQRCGHLREGMVNSHTWGLLFGAQKLYMSVSDLIRDSVSRSGKVDPARALEVLRVADDLTERAGFGMPVAKLCRHLTGPITAVAA
jgi:hypothetical protein